MTTVNTFETYLKAHQPRHLNYARRLTRNSDDAEDLLQETKIRALRALGNLECATIPDAWFRQIMKNCFLDSWRYQNRRVSTTSLDAIQEANPVFEVADPSFSHLNLPFLEEEFSPAMRRALARLTPQQRNLIIADLHGKSCAELSKAMQCGAITARTRLHRAHRSLRRHLYLENVGPKPQ